MAGSSKEPREPTFLPLADPKQLWGTTVSNVEALRANPRRVAVDLLRLFIANKTPVTLWGPVGARKTRTIEALSAQVDENGTPYQVITLQPSTQDPTIIHGMMYTSREGDRTVMRRSVPRVAEQVVEYANENNGLTILFADEMTTCMPSQQNAMLGLLTHGRFEDIDISKHIAIVMAANPEGTVSSVIPLNEAVLNRGGHLAWYGDSTLFLEEWSTGFNGATTPPEQQTVRFVSAMFRQAPERVFRSQDSRWSPDALVPWEMLEHTERAVTESARMMELVGSVLADAPEFVRDHYTVEVTRALLGPWWADVSQSVVDQQRDGASRTGVLAWVRRVSTSALLGAASLDEIVSVHGSPWVEGLRHDQAAHILGDLAKAAFSDDGVFSADNYYGGWAIACAAPTEGDRGGLSAQMAQLSLAGRAAVTAGALDKDAFLPGFVNEDVRAWAKQAFVEYEAASA